MAVYPIRIGSIRRISVWLADRTPGALQAQIVVHRQEGGWYEWYSADKRILAAAKVPDELPPPAQIVALVESVVSPGRRACLRKLAGAEYRQANP